jgi:hypothetical protein
LLFFFYEYIMLLIILIHLKSEGDDMILKVGEKIHVIIRRRFENDLRRHFLGEITAVCENTVRLKGYVFVLDHSTNQYIKKPELRTRIFSLVDGINVINLIPPAVILEKVSYRLSADKSLVVTDGEHFSLDVNEFGIRF